jgi:hypothetical protein
MQTLETVKQQIEQVRKLIVEAGAGDTTRLEATLRKLRQEEEDLRKAQEFDADMADLKRQAETRLAWQAQVRDIQVRTKRQGEAIESFLPLRDSVTALIKQVAQKVQELTGAQELCFKEFPDSAAFRKAIVAIPPEYLSAGLVCPILVSNHAGWEARLSELPIASDLESWGDHMNTIVNVPDIIPALPPAPADLVDVDLEEGDLAGPGSKSCCVCDHPLRADIEKAMAEGRTLRDIEAEFKDVSKSSLSRHSKHMVSEEPSSLSQQPVETMKVG